MEGRLERGPLLLSLGRVPEAVTAYEEILNGRPTIACVSSRARASGTPRRPRATSRLPSRPPEAQGRRRRLPGGAFYKDRAAYHEARIAELRGNAEDAKKLYREVLDKNPTTSLRDEITNRLAVLELK